MKLGLRAGFFGASGLLLCATLLWPQWSLGRRRDATRQEAGVAMATIVAGEHDFLRVHRRYAPFGPAATDRQSALPGLQLGPAADDFTFDGLPDPAGTFRVRAVTRADAVAAGRVVPLSTTIALETQNGSLDDMTHEDMTRKEIAPTTAIR